MSLWWRAVVSAIRRLPRSVRYEWDALRRERDFQRRLDEATATAQWICPMHRDAWLGPDGRFYRAVGDYILPMNDWDAEDFHGFEKAAA